MATVGIPVPDFISKKVLEKLDAIRDKFLGIPSNTRVALDKLSRIRMLLNQTGAASPEINTAAQLIEANLQRVQTEWNNSANRFTQIDDLRRSGSLLNADTLSIAASLALSVGYVVKNADASIAAVDALARKYLTADQQSQLQVSTLGVAGGMSTTTVAILALGAFYFLRRR